MAAGPLWGSLPSIAILEILSYLSHEDRLKVSSVCKRWRMCLFHPSLWHRITFDVGYTSRQKAKFLAERCGRFVREAVLRFNSHNITEVRESSKILSLLCANKNLQYFSLQPSSCHIEWPDTQTHFIDRYITSVENIITNSRKLQHFSLGYSEDILEHSSRLLELLGQTHANTLKELHLASVKEDAENYGIIELDAYQFQPFMHLTHISLDYDYLSNSMLQGFAEKRRSTANLERLILHVHGVNTSHEKIKASSWQMLSACNPKLKVTLNLIHSMEGVDALLDILAPSMPLSHFRQFFCTHINTAAMTYMSYMYRDTLESVYILDGLLGGYPVPYVATTDEDPFVMIAWRCHNLKHFSLLGYEISDNEIIAIARLRGDKLETFEIPLCCIYFVGEDDEGEQWASHCSSTCRKEFTDLVSEGLSFNWRPTEDHSLPTAVFDDRADAEKAYMNILLADQQ